MIWGPGIIPMNQAYEGPSNMASNDVVSGGIQLYQIGEVRLDRSAMLGQGTRAEDASFGEPERCEKMGLITKPHHLGYPAGNYS